MIIRFTINRDSERREHSLYFNTGLNYIYKYFDVDIKTNKFIYPEFISCLKRFYNVINNNSYLYYSGEQVKVYINKNSQIKKYFYVKRFMSYDCKGMFDSKITYDELIYMFGKAVYLNRYKLEYMIKSLGGK